MASSNVNSGPPLIAVNSWPSSTKSTVSTVPAGRGPGFAVVGDVRDLGVREDRDVELGGLLALVSNQRLGVMRGMAGAPVERGGLGLSDDGIERDSSPPPASEQPALQLLRTADRSVTAAFARPTDRGARCIAMFSTCTDGDARPIKMPLRCCGSRSSELPMTLLAPVDHGDEKSEDLSPAGACARPPRTPRVGRTTAAAGRRGRSARARPSWPGGHLSTASVMPGGQSMKMASYSSDNGSRGSPRGGVGACRLSRARGRGDAARNPPGMTSRAGPCGRAGRRRLHPGAYEPAVALPLGHVPRTAQHICRRPLRIEIPRRVSVARLPRRAQPGDRGRRLADATLDAGDRDRRRPPARPVLVASHA